VSPVYYFNILATPLWGFGMAGYFVDLATPRWRDYPSNIYIDMRQNDNQYFTYDILNKPYEKLTNVISITPLRLIDLFNPAVEITYERRWAPHLSTQFMASYLLPESGIRNVFGLAVGQAHNAKGFKVSAEQKFYLHPTAPQGFYVSGEVSYLHSRYDQYESGGYFLSGSSYWVSREDIFSVKKQMAVVNFKFGYQHIIDHFTIDCFVGLGLQYKNVVHSNKEAWNHATLTGFYNNDIKGVAWMFNVPLNVRLGWAF
jgi:hypothetical protein